jgi:hypothetical protein
VNAGVSVLLIQAAVEHQKDLWFYLLECSAVSKRSINQGHQTYFEDTMQLAKLPHYIRRVTRECTEINVRENFSREGCYQLHPTWKIIHTVNQQRGHHNHTHAVNPMQKKEQLQ